MASKDPNELRRRAFKLVAAAEQVHTNPAASNDPVADMTGILGRVTQLLLEAAAVERDDAARAGDRNAEMLYARYAGGLSEALGKHSQVHRQFEALRDFSEEQPSLHGKGPRTDMLASDFDDMGAHHLMGASSAQEETGGFASIGEMLQSIYKMRTGQGMDERLAPCAASVHERIGHEGGFAIPTGFTIRALQDHLGDTVLLRLCDRVPMLTNKESVPTFPDSDHSTTSPFGITWEQIPEDGEMAAQGVTLGKRQLTAHKSGGLFFVSNEWLDDARPEIQNRLTQVATRSLRWYIEQKLWRGTGAGEALGALNSPGTLEISKEAGQAADTLVTENICAMWARLLPGSESRAIWVCNKTSFPQLATMTLAVGAGGAPVGLMQPYGGVAGEPAHGIFGRPLFYSEHLPVLGDAGDLVLLDPTLYLMGDRQQVIVDVSGHARFEHDQTAIRLKVRFDGQSLLDSVLTPANGDSCGWCVTTEAR